MTTQTIKSRGSVTIDVEQCKGCELCIPVCPPNVLDTPPLTVSVFVLRVTDPPRPASDLTVRSTVVLSVAPGDRVTAAPVPIAPAAATLSVPAVMFTWLPATNELAAVPRVSVPRGRPCSSTSNPPLDRDPRMVTRAGILLSP